MAKNTTKTKTALAANAAAPAGGAGTSAPAPALAAAATPNPNLQEALEQATQAQLEEGITLDLEESAPATPAASEDADNADDPEEDDAADEPADAAEGSDETTETEEAAAEGEGEEFEAENAEELDHEATAKGWPKSASKRLGKLLKKVHGLEAQLEGAAQLREERDALKAKLEAGTVSNDGPAGATPRTVTALERQFEQDIAVKEQWLATIDANPDGLTLTDGQGKETVYTPEQLRQAKTRFMRELFRTESQLDAHRAHLRQQTAQHNAAAREQHAFLKEKTSPEYQAIQKVLTEFPEAQRIPDAMSVLADAMAWRKQQAAAAKAANGNGNGNGNGTAKAKPPAPAVRQPGRPGAAPVTANGQANAMGQRRQNFLKTGNLDDGNATILSLVESAR